VYFSQAPGKTILASVIIEACLRTPQSVTSYFYCRHGDSAANTCVSILRGLLSQLVSQNRDLMPYFHDFFIRSDEPVLLSEHVMKQLIELICQTNIKKYIVVDGLDECESKQRKSILSFFRLLAKNLDSKDPGSLRILIVSQDESDIRKDLCHADVLRLEEDGAADVAKDIESFATTWSGKICSKFNLTPEQTDYIKNTTCRKARGKFCLYGVMSDINITGMFLYAKLVLEHFHAQSTLKELRSEIAADHFPDGLEEA